MDLDIEDIEPEIPQPGQRTNKRRASQGPKESVDAAGSAAKKPKKTEEEIKGRSKATKKTQTGKVRARSPIMKTASGSSSKGTSSSTDACNSGRKGPQTPADTGTLARALPSGAIRLGTDFSGLETPSVNLTRCKIPFVLEFACEKDKRLRDMLTKVHTPTIVFDDIETRNLRKVPVVDLYVSGFACQPYSTIGKGLGEQDPECGDHLQHSLKYILSHRPRVAVLENVPGMLQENQEDLEDGAVGLEVRGLRSPVQGALDK